MRNENILAQENRINRTEGYRTGESDVYETRFSTVSEAYKGFQREYGRCTGKVYVDDPSGKPKQVGWVFVKRQTSKVRRFERYVFTGDLGDAAQ